MTPSYGTILFLTISCPSPVSEPRLPQFLLKNERKNMKKVGEILTAKWNKEVNRSAVQRINKNLAEISAQPESKLVHKIINENKINKNRKKPKRPQNDHR